MVRSRERRGVGGGEGRVNHGGDGRGSRLRTIARRATVCRARPGSEGRSDDRKDREREDPNDLKI